MLMRSLTVLSINLSIPLNPCACGRTLLRPVNGSGRSLVPAASLMKCYLPPNKDYVEYPEKNKLRFFDKVPVTSTTQRPKKMKKQKILTRGPELIHNKLQYGDYGIQATAGGNLRQAHLEMVRLTLNRKMDDSRMFAMWRVDQPWKSVTKKGQGHRMGGGKGSIDHYVFPVKAGRLIVEMGGNCEFEEVARMLRQVAQKLPFAARVVNREILEMDEMREKFYKENNINPFTFEYLIKHNFLGCGKFMSPYDKIWHGKYR